MKQSLIISISFILLIFSCQKENVNFPLQKIDVNINSRINDIFFLNQLKGFAVGGDRYTSGFVLLTEDGGKTWQNIKERIDFENIDATQTLNSIDFLNDSIGEIVGHGGIILHTTNGGNSWSLIRNGSWSNMYDTKVFGEHKTLIATGGAYEFGSLFSSTNEWYYFERTDFSYAIRDLEFVNNDIGYYSGYGYVNKTIDGGKTWKILDLQGDYFFNMDFIDKNVGFVCGWEGGIYKTIDGGSTWKTIHPVNQGFSTRHHFENIDFIDENTGLVCGYNGELFYTQNAGKIWQKIEMNTKTNFHSLYFLNKNTAFVGGENGLFFKISF